MRPIIRSHALSSRDESPFGWGNIFHRAVCGFLYTQDPPDEKEIGYYYNIPDYMPHQDDLPVAYKIIRWFRNGENARTWASHPGN